VFRSCGKATRGTRRDGRGSAPRISAAVLAALLAAFALVAPSPSVATSASLATSEAAAPTAASTPLSSPELGELARASSVAPTSSGVPNPSVAPPSTAASPATGASTPSTAASPLVAPRPVLVWLRNVVPAAVEDIRYATPRNFVGRRIDGYEAAKCLLTPAAAAAIAKAQAELAAQDLRLVVWDCYRPERAVAHFVRWARDLSDIATKAEYYPDVPKEELFARGYISERSGHSRGSTIDVGLLRSDPESDRFVTVDMGTAYDFFDPRSHTDSPEASTEVRRNRDLLRDVLSRAGFANLPEEWWHFTLENEPYPQTTFDVPVH
jgi:zinc D-Ala-D-Ala dipeptidase